MNERLAERVVETVPTQGEQPRVEEAREVSSTEPSTRVVIEEISLTKERKTLVREVKMTRTINVLVSVQTRSLPQEPTRVAEVTSTNILDVMVGIARESGENVE